MREKSTFDQLKANIKEKTKNFAENFTIQIASGPPKDKFINNDNDIELLFCDESQLEITLKKV